VTGRDSAHENLLCEADTASESEQECILLCQREKRERGSSDRRQWQSVVEVRMVARSGRGAAAASGGGLASVMATTPRG
jgi:hypothetical protein